MNPSLEPVKLVIDLGNSRAKVAVYSQKELKWMEVIGNPKPEKFISSGIQRFDVRAGIISSVAANSEEYTALFPNLNWIVLDENTPLPVKNNYQTPGTLGKDRIAAVAGAHFLFPDKDLLVIDAGTALTFDFISASGEYPGGSISPGMSMRFRALNTFTHRLPLLEASEINYITGRTTTESILSGVINGIRTEIDGIIDEYKLLWPSLNVIMTGGDTKYFEKSLKNGIFAFPNLVLTGLNLILDYNLEK
jgi:type III pantothenate kinase